MFPAMIRNKASHFRPFLLTFLYWQNPPLAGVFYFAYISFGRQIMECVFFFSKVLDLPRHQQDSSSTTSTKRLTIRLTLLFMESRVSSSGWRMFRKSWWFVYSQYLHALLLLSYFHQQVIGHLLHSILPQDRWLLSK
jgi:hypothetical protein